MSKLAAVLAPAFERARRARSHFGGGAEFHPQMGMPRADVIRHQNVDRLADQFAGGVAEQPLRFRIGQHDITGGIDHHDADRTGLDRFAKNLFGVHLRARAKAVSRDHGGLKREITSGRIAT